MPFVVSPVYVASPLYVASPSGYNPAVSVSVDASEVRRIVPADALGINWWFDQGFSFDATNAPALFDGRGMGVTTIRASAVTDIYQWSAPGGNNAAQVAQFGPGYAYLTTGYGPTGLRLPQFVPNGIGAPLPSIDNFIANIINNMSPKPRVVAMANCGSNAANTALNPNSDVLGMLAHYYDLGVTPVAVEYGNERYASAAYQLRPGSTKATPAGSAWAGGGPYSANAYAQAAVSLMNAIATYTNADPTKQAAIRSVKVIISIWHDGTPDQCVYTAADDQAAGDGTGLGWTHSVMKPTAGNPQLAGYQYHAYTAFPSPGYIDDDLMTSANVNDAGLRFCGELMRFYGAASSAQLWITEFSTVGTAHPSRQTVEITGALFSAIAYGKLMLQGIATMPTWFANAAVVDPAAPDPGTMGLYGTRQFGDFGVVGRGDGPQPYGQPYSVWYALSMLQNFCRPGDTILVGRSPNPLVFVFACKRQSGHLCLMIVNAKTVDMTVSVGLANFTPAGPVTRYRLTASAPTTIQQTATTWASPLTIPAYTLDVYDLS